MRFSHILPGQAADVRCCVGKPISSGDLPGTALTLRASARNISLPYFDNDAHSTELNVVQQNPATTAQCQINRLSLAIPPLSEPPT